MKLVTLIILTAHAGAAQTPAPWTPPKTIKQYCIEIEGVILGMYKTMVEINQKAGGNVNADERRQGILSGQSFLKLIKDDEEEWQRLGCAHILYPPGSTRP